jgi:hypothetical protein
MANEVKVNVTDKPYEPRTINAGDILVCKLPHVHKVARFLATSAYGRYRLVNLATGDFSDMSLLDTWVIDAQYRDVTIEITEGIKVR